MRRVLLISLTLVLVLVAWTTVCAEDGFYVISGVKRNYAPVPKTGQTTPYAAGDDRTLQKGVAWPTPRFTENGDGTVTDKLTGLIWMLNAGAMGPRTWAIAVSMANVLHSGTYDLQDGSKEGDWRLPNVRELQSLVDYGRYNPALPNTLGTGKWAEGDPFQNVQVANYWSSTSLAWEPTIVAWTVFFDDGSLYADLKAGDNYVWCVRGGK